ncbi:hypothetical protein PA598K_02715 [Paenibacillus sp. 598K]|uniref:hypothetical protein n=1 Tax=Paenibacillus sp. 598K TaxID=1117987 RepID=UPI000FFAB02E|nr:hypothetical protein [Paenibacillus sp. 598K]GBF74372.1 hypothetical protein PA598K_02715 [Paenibacillus sp. 598K]
MSKLLLYELRKTPLAFLMISLFVMLLFKGVVTIAYFDDHDREWRQAYSKYLTYALAHDPYAAEQELNVIKGEFSRYSAEAEAIDTLLEQMKDREYYERVQQVAQTASGYVFSMPSDFEKFRSAYASYNIPAIVNVLGYQLFLKLNNVNFIPIISILAFSSFFSIERETGMQSIIRTTGTGWGKVFRKKLTLAIGASTLIFSLGYIFDLFMTLTLSDFRSMGNPYRSVISTVLTNDSIGMFLIKYYVIGILNAIFISCLVLLFSSLTKNSRLSYAISGLTYVAFTVIGATVDKLDKVAILISGNLIKLNTETSLIAVTNSLIVEEYTIIFLIYIVFIPLLIYLLKKTS